MESVISPAFHIEADVRLIFRFDFTSIEPVGEIKDRVICQYAS